LRLQNIPIHTHESNSNRENKPTIDLNNSFNQSYANLFSLFSKGEELPRPKGHSQPGSIPCPLFNVSYAAIKAVVTIQFRFD